MPQLKLKTRKRNRSMNYDCSQNGYYFEKVCTKDKIDYFFNYSVVVGISRFCFSTDSIGSY